MNYNQISEIISQAIHKSSEKKDKDVAKLNLISSIVQAISSAVSVGAAIFAIYLTLSSRGEDLSNLELQNSPHLIVDVDRENFNVFIENVGAGAAFIKYTKLKVRNEEVENKDLDRYVNQNAKLKTLIDQMVFEVADLRQLSTAIKKEYLGEYAFTKGFLPNVGNVIASEAKFNIITLRSKTLSDENKVNQAIFNKWSFDFGNFPDNVEVNICYCSISGKTCKILSVPFASRSKQVKECR